MSNKFGLSDGTTFIIDCDKEADKVTARKDKLTFLLSQNIEAMTRDKKWNVEAVRALSTCLVATTKGGKRLGKADLLDNLRVMQEAEREARKVEYAQMFERHNDPQDLQREVESFISMLADLSINTDNLADIALNRLKSRYKTDKGLIKTGIVEFKRLIRLHHAVGHIDTARVDEVLGKLSTLTSEANKNIAIEYAQTVAKQSADCVKVNPSFLYDHALTTLSDLSNDSKSFWKDVSIALSFATGRRMSEVHGIKTTFEVVGEYSVKFCGQVKTKGRGEVPAYVIPTLIPAELVVRGFEYLRVQGKLYDTALVNARVSKAMSNELPARLKVILSKAKINTYKDLRAVYCLVLLEHKPVNYTASAFYSQLLGHGEYDLTTSNSYQTFYTEETFNPVTHEPIDREPDYSEEWDKVGILE